MPAVRAVARAALGGGAMAAATPLCGARRQ